MTTSPLVPIVAAVGGFTLGAVAVWLATPSPTSSPSTSTAVAPAAPAPSKVVKVLREDCDCPEPEEQVTRCEREVALRDRVIESLERDLYGEPIRWPEELPERFAPEFFEREVPRILEECGARESLVDIDCEEPPCIVMLRPGEEMSSLSQCAAWNDTYGATVSMAMGKVECMDGSEERYVSMSPYWEGLGEQEQENYATRMGARWKQIEIDWPCQ